MKKLCSITISFMLILAFCMNTVTAFSYSDINPMYAPSSAKSYYSNSTGDNLQARANCYGYALRMHYLHMGKTEYEDPNYRQIPGEFGDRTAQRKTFPQLFKSLMTNISLLSVYTNILKDLNTLGYELNSSESFMSISSDYVPPAANSKTDRRIILVIKNANSSLQKGGDFHFYMQNTNNNRWSHKQGALPASDKCGSHTNVTLTDQNISQHIHCYGYDGDSMLLTISAPGTTDMCHANGHYESSYVTENYTLDTAGEVCIAAQVTRDISSAVIRGRMDNVGDVDYHVFNVTSAKSYTFDIWKRPDLDLTVVIGQVSSSGSALSGGIYTLTKTETTKSVTGITLSPNQYYYIKVYSNTTQHLPSMEYKVTIS